MNKYMIDFAFAFQRVPLRFYEFPGLNARGEYTQYLENNFTSEMARHFRNNKEYGPNIPYYENLELDFDIRKERLEMQPDLVLHAGNNNMDRQEIFAEVKTNPDYSLDDDLLKLFKAIQELNFNYAVMIVVNKTFVATHNAISRCCQMNEMANPGIMHKLFLFHSVKNENNITANYTISNFRDLLY